MKALALIALFAPGLALAGTCAHSEARSLSPDLEGVRTVRLEIHANDLHLLPAGATSQVTARACASRAEELAQLVLVQERLGDTLVIRAERQGQSSGIFFNATYAYLDIRAELPAGLAYEVKVGSGDAWVSGVSSLRAEVGSGDLDVRDVAGPVDLRVGSGDITARAIGPLEVRSVGSGDFSAQGVRGDARIDEVGSGDVELADVDGHVRIDSIGSGDADVSDVRGDLVVRRLGSGDVHSHRIGGRTDVPADD